MLTVSKIRTIQPRDRRFMLADGSGLWLEVHPSGKMAWRSRYTLARRAGKTNLGYYPHLSLADARKRHSALMAGVAAGLSPAEIRRAEKLATERGATVRAFGERYLTYLAEVRRDVKPIRRYLERDVYPVMGDKPVSKVTADDVRPLIFDRVDDGRRQSALAIRNLLKRVWDYAMVRGLTDKNPLHAIPGKLVAKPSSRTRALKPSEIGAFLRALDSAKIRRPLKIALRLILLNLTRKGEMRLARWDEFDLDRGVWEIPETHSKSGAQIVYLSRQAVELLRELRLTSKTACVFPATWAVNTPMSADTLNKALARVPAKLSHFTVHDLRRTAATSLSEQEYAADVIEKALNHKIKGVRGIYNRAQYAEPRRAMLQAWADWLDRLGG